MKENMNNNWNVSGLILEGISGTGKTQLLHEILQSKRFREKNYLSSMVLTEHQTQRVLERKEREDNLTVADNISLLEQHVNYLELISNRLDNMKWCRNNQTNMRVPYILERFHFTHVFHYKHINWEDIVDVDSRLAKMNCKLCVLNMDDSQFMERIINIRDIQWRNYLKRYGDTDEEILDYYRKQQDLLLSISKKSKLKTLNINTSKPLTQDTVNQVIDFWEI